MVGRTLTHYSITAAIGAGGMGEVYRATDTKLGRDVALKVLPSEMASHPERLERFRREARTVAALNHPNIVTIHSVEEADGVRFLTMELVDETVMAVEVDTRGVFRAGVPRALFTGPYELRTMPQRNYDVGPDDRFVLVKRKFISSKPREPVVLDGWAAADPSRPGAP